MRLLQLLPEFNDLGSVFAPISGSLLIDQKERSLHTGLCHTARGGGEACAGAVL